MLGAEQLLARLIPLEVVEELIGEHEEAAHPGGPPQVDEDGTLFAALKEGDSKKPPPKKKGDTCV